MKKILFLLGMYYPNYSANGLCTKNVVDELVKDGCDVTCICNSSGKNNKNENIDGANLYYIKPRLHQAINMKSDPFENPKIKKICQKVAILLSKTQLFFMAEFWPLISPLYAWAFYAKARELYKTEKFDMIVAVYTPFESLLAGYLLKRKYPEIKYVPYYLDALAGGWGPSFFTKKRIEKNTRRWEKKIDEVADYVISMHSSENYHIENPICSIEKRIYLDVPVMKKQYICNNEKAYAFYAGGLNYSGRGVEELLEIFSIVCSKIEMKLLLAGPCKNPQIFDRYRKMTNGRIEYLGTLSHEDVISLEKEAKYLVNLGSNNPYTIPSKIFEYMRFGKTIISTYRREDEPSIEYLDKYKNVIYIDERLPFEQSASKLLEELQTSKAKENIDLEKVFYANTPMAFAKTIKDIIK